jgi:hypothetical protein
MPEHHGSELTLDLFHFFKVVHAGGHARAFPFNFVFGHLLLNKRGELYLIARLVLIVPIAHV